MPPGSSFPLSTQGRITLTPSDHGWSTELTVFLADRPGSLAHLARTAARHDANITRFVFNRAESPNRVQVTAFVRRATRAAALLEDLRHEGLLAPREEEAVAGVPDPDAILTMKVRLVDRPGTLAAFAELLARHDANVIFMQYDGDVAPGQCQMSMVAPSAADAAALLGEITEANYDFHVEYRGSDPEAYHSIIGLSAVEVFFLRLREGLPDDARRELRRLVESSEQLQRSLIEFRRESAQSEESLAASAVFEDVLELATMSLRKLGPHFTLRSVGPMPVSERVWLVHLTPPTGGSCYLLGATDADDLTLIDAGYGLYYDDWKAWIERLGFDPRRIRRVFLTHADTDHAGFAGALQEEMGAEVLAHPGCPGIWREGNRAAGSDTRLMTLNLHFTQLVTAFTRAHHPATIHPFERTSADLGGFPLLGAFEVADVRFDVLESLGGHTPGCVFFLAPEAGLLFSSDYLIDLRSLSDHDRARLSVPKHLMISTNADSSIFTREMTMLQELMLEVESQLSAEGRKARVLPGHGDAYHVDEAYAIGAWRRE